MQLAALPLGIISVMIVVGFWVVTRAMTTLKVGPGRVNHAPASCLVIHHIWVFQGLETKP